MNTNDALKIIEIIPSLEIRNYLRENINCISILQLATLIYNYGKNNKIELFKILVDSTSNPYEKKLFSVAIKEYEK